MCKLHNRYNPLKNFLCWNHRGDTNFQDFYNFYVQYSSSEISFFIGLIFSFLGITSCLGTPPPALGHAPPPSSPPSLGIPRYMTGTRTGPTPSCPGASGCPKYTVSDRWAAAHQPQYTDNRSVTTLFLTTSYNCSGDRNRGVATAVLRVPSYDI